MKTERSFGWSLTEARNTAWRLLPLTLLVIMIAVGVGIEAARLGGVEWWPKLPLLGLLAWGFGFRRSATRP